MNSCYLLLWLMAGWLGCDSPAPAVVSDSGDKKPKAQWDTPAPDTLRFQRWLTAQPGILGKVASQAKGYRLQVFCTLVDASGAEPAFQHFACHAPNREYFNPASTVKLPAAIIALKQMEALGTNRVGVHTPLHYIARPEYCSPERSRLYPGAPEPLTLNNLLALALTVSDDDAYNALYDFSGRARLHEELKRMGFPEVRLLQKFDPACSPEECRHAPEIQFKDPSGAILQNLPRRSDSLVRQWPAGIDARVGTGFRTNEGKMLNGPRDFNGSNWFPLSDLHRLMGMVFFPDAFPEAQQPNLSPSSDSLLRAQLRQLPAQSGISKLARPPYHSAWTQYFFCGNKPGMVPPDTLEVYNIVGQAYGFLSECAWIYNPRTGKGMVLTAGLYVNQDGILNDGQYEYEAIGFPFLQALSTAIQTFAPGKP